MAEDIGLRFYLVKRLDKIPYGDAIALPRRDVQKAWPPTGDYDRSDAGMFRSIALAAGGHRPETSMTSIDRIHNDFGELELPPLDRQFDVSQDPLSGDYLIKRKLDKCPHCRGRGVIEEYELCDVPLKFSDYVPEDKTVTINTVPCDHAPE